MKGSWNRRRNRCDRYFRIVRINLEKCCHLIWGQFSSYFWFYFFIFETTQSFPLFVPFSLEALVVKRLKKKKKVMGGPEAFPWWLRVSQTCVWKIHCNYWQQERTVRPKGKCQVEETPFQMSCRPQASPITALMTSREHTPISRCPQPQDGDSCSWLVTLGIQGLTASWQRLVTHTERRVCGHDPLQSHGLTAGGSISGRRDCGSSGLTRREPREGWGLVCINTPDLVTLLNLRGMHY